MTKEQIIQDFRRYIEQYINTNYKDWYVGVTSEPNQRLFEDHEVPENGDAWIYSTKVTDEISRSIEKFFLEEMDADGGTGGGENCCYVYAYLKRVHTKP